MPGKALTLFQSVPNFGNHSVYFSQEWEYWRSFSNEKLIPIWVYFLLSRREHGFMWATHYFDRAAYR